MFFSTFFYQQRRFNQKYSEFGIIVFINSLQISLISAPSFNHYFLQRVFCSVITYSKVFFLFARKASQLQKLNCCSQYCPSLLKYLKLLRYFIDFLPGKSFHLEFACGLVQSHFPDSKQHSSSTTAFEETQNVNLRQQWLKSKIHGFTPTQ